MLVGLIANPASSKDIRRLVGLARVVDSSEKANMVARLLAGLAAGPALEVAALDDGAGLIRRGLHLAGSRTPSFRWLDIQPTRTELDTRVAAAALADARAGAVIVVGGDGTMRAVVEGWPDAPLVPVSAGTNNVIGLTVEPTVIGYATALAVGRDGGVNYFRPIPCVEVSVAGARATAVVDAVGVRNRFVGAGGLWEPEMLVEAVVTYTHPSAVGIASVAAALGPHPPGTARYLRFGPGATVRAVLGPGLVVSVEVASSRTLTIGDVIEVDKQVALLALDGERRLPGAGATMAVRSGPRLLDPAAVLADRQP
jgi:hypothetical protein